MSLTAVVRGSPPILKPSHTVSAAATATDGTAAFTKGRQFRRPSELPWRCPFRVEPPSRASAVPISGRRVPQEPLELTAQPGKVDRLGEITVDAHSHHFLAPGGETVCSHRNHSQRTSHQQMQPPHDLDAVVPRQVDVDAHHP